MKKKTLVLIISAAVVVVVALVVLLCTMETPSRLASKAEKALQAGDTEQAIELYERAGDKCGDASRAYDYYYQAAMLCEDDSRGFNLMVKATERGSWDAADYCLSALHSYGQQEKDLHIDVPHFVEAYKALPEDYSRGNYIRETQLVWMYLYRPEVANADSAGAILLRYMNASGQFPSGFDKNKVCLYSLAVDLLISGKGGFDASCYNAFSLKESVRAYDSELFPEVMLSFGDLDLLGNMLDTWRSEICVQKAMEHYQRAYYSDVLDKESIEQRIAVLTAFDNAYQAANDRSSYYGYDTYYGVGPLDGANWKSFFNAESRFEYDGQMSGTYPHGQGFGCWGNERSAFVGVWEHGNPAKGIMVTRTGSQLK